MAGLTASADLKNQGTFHLSRLRRAPFLLCELDGALNSAVECHLHTITIDPPAVDYKEVR